VRFSNEVYHKTVARIMHRLTRNEKGIKPPSTVRPTSKSNTKKRTTLR
jgi:hypothetical protein